MIFIPLPFVVTLLLIIVLVQLLRRNGSGSGRIGTFALLIASYALQSAVVGLRWGYGFTALIPLQVTLATWNAALTWISFRGLANEEPQPLWRSWPHALPSALIVALLVFWRDPLDIAIDLILFAYGLALLWLARRGPDALIASRLDGTMMSYRALVITGAALLGNVAVDIFISLDMTRNHGAYSACVVAASNIVTLLLFSGAATAASFDDSPRDSKVAVPERTTVLTATDEDAALAASADALMADKQFYKDADLNLGRIARRMHLPARRVSVAINRIHNKSVSQYVNDFRIDEARQLLADTDEPVTRIMFEVGFQTKSNFNREFLRVTGLNPTSWRERYGKALAV